MNWDVGADHGPGEGEAGFTLLELLVAMTLLGILMIMVFGGLRFGVRVWERSGEHVSGLDEVRLAQQLLRDKLEAAYPYYDVSDPARPHVTFEGTSGSMSFLAPASLSAADGQRAFTTFQLEEVGDHKTMIMRSRPELAHAGDKTLAEEDRILDGIESAQFSYFGQLRQGEAAGWHDDWSNAQRLPVLVRVSVKFAQSEGKLWPDLVVAPLISVDVSCVYDPLTKYCQGR